MLTKLEKALSFADQDFDLDLGNVRVTSHDEFLAILTKVIKHLLDNDMERLLNGLYRIDVDENLFKQAFTAQKDVAREIALLIIERELKKVETREQYKPGANNPDVLD